MAEKEKISKEEKAEQQLKLKEQKAKDAKRKKKITEAKKRINTIVKMPFKILLNSTLFVSLILFIFIYFWLQVELYQTIIYVFFIFTAIYLSVGITMAYYYYMLSEDKIKELNEKILNDQKRKEDEEKQRQQQEMEELEAIEREMLERRNRNKEVPKIEEEDEIIEEPLGTNTDELGSLPQFDNESDDYLNEILGNEFKNNQN